MRHFIKSCLLRHVKLIREKIKTLFPACLIDKFRLIRLYVWRFIWYIRGSLLPQKYQNISVKKRNLYWINPSKIIYTSMKEFDIYRDNGKYLGGNWDLLENKFEEQDFYKSICARINDNKEWPDLGYYQRILKEISQGNIKWSCRTKGELDKRCQKLESIYEDIKTINYKTNRFGDEIALSIGRHGDLLFNNGRHRLTFCKMLGIKEIPVKIIVRHSKWIKFKKEILFYAKNYKGKVYAPLTHIDFQWIPSHHTDRRFKLIKNNLSVKKGTLLDIGSHWGYFCHKFEKEGFECYSVENDPTNLYFLKKLRRAEKRQFTIVSESIFSFCKHKKRKFDVVLALAIFHHFIKQEKSFHQLIELLKNLDMKEMVFQPHLPNETQMNRSFRNFKPEEFIAFILEYSCLTTIKMIGYEETGRPIYIFTK